MNGLALPDAYEIVRERKADYPLNYKGLGTMVGTGSQLIQPETYFNANSYKFNTAPLMEFRGDTQAYIASKPILVKSYREDGVFFAENESLVLFGTGASPEEALLDFVKHLGYFFNFYKRQNERDLIGDAVRLKKVYSDLLVEA